MSDFVNYGIEGLPLRAISKHLKNENSVCAFNFDVKGANDSEIILRLMMLINSMREHLKLMAQPDIEATDLDVECIEEYAFEFINILTLRIGSVYDVLRAIQDNSVIMEYDDIECSLICMLDNVIDYVINLGKVSKNLTDNELENTRRFNMMCAIYWMYMIVESIERYGLVKIYDVGCNPFISTMSEDEDPTPSWCENNRKVCKEGTCKCLVCEVCADSLKD